MFAFKTAAAPGIFTTCRVSLLMAAQEASVMHGSLLHASKLCAKKRNIKEAANGAYAVPWHAPHFDHIHEVYTS